MKARFELKGLNDVVLVIEPAYGDESMLMATFLKFDANVFYASVDRREDGSVIAVTLSAGSDR